MSGCVFPCVNQGLLEKGHVGGYGGLHGGSVGLEDRLEFRGKLDEAVAGVVGDAVERDSPLLSRHDDCGTGRPGRLPTVAQSGLMVVERRLCIRRWEIIIVPLITREVCLPPVGALGQTKAGCSGGTHPDSDASHASKNGYGSLGVWDKSDRGSPQNAKCHVSLTASCDPTAAKASLRHGRFCSHRVHTLLLCLKFQPSFSFSVTHGPLECIGAQGYTLHG